VRGVKPTGLDASPQAGFFFFPWMWCWFSFFAFFPHDCVPPAMGFSARQPSCEVFLVASSGLGQLSTSFLLSLGFSSRIPCRFEILDFRVDNMALVLLKMTVSTRFEHPTSPAAFQLESGGQGLILVSFFLLPSPFFLSFLSFHP